MDNKELYLQLLVRDYIKKEYGNSVWIQVSGHADLYGADAGFWCGFVKKEYIDKCKRNFSWDIALGDGAPGFEMNNKGTEYKSVLLDEGLEPLLFYRDYYGVANDYVEISQEFILLNNLRYDQKKKSYYAMYDSGKSEEAVKYIDKCTIEIQTKFLKKYAAAKQLAILLFYDVRTRLPGELSDYGFEEFSEQINENDVICSINGGELDFNRKVFSRMLGKKIIRPNPVETCGFWPYEKKKQYEEYIIGKDSVGEPVYYTCDPDKLNNYFNANPDAPMYLTPVFFDREVLQKYYSKPDLYEICDGELSCQRLWGMEIDNHHKETVAVYLGDLGQHLPEEEQMYWKQYNILCDESLSEVSFGRDILNCFMDSNIIEHQFKRDYSDLNKAWEKVFGWPLYIPFSKEDSYVLNQIRRPLGDSQEEFDQLVLLLGKVLIDSLNEKEISKEITTKEKDMKGIAKLEEWLKEHEASEFDEHISFLHDLWNLRSSGSGHRKGDRYERMIQLFDINVKPLPDVYDDILKQADQYLRYMMDTFV